MIEISDEEDGTLLVVRYIALFQQPDCGETVGVNRAVACAKAFQRSYIPSLHSWNLEESILLLMKERSIDHNKGFFWVAVRPSKMVNYTSTYTIKN